LWHHPTLPEDALRPEFRGFPWRRDAAGLRAWQRGRTGVPIVDAGMRQLWSIGWMHNRVRMITASFLIKHLLVSWQEGDAWFWDTLVDGDLASNSANWQWVAGCGADPSPFFRIFNPVLQGKKFDRDGDYVRRWVPELASLDTKFIHDPWAAPPQALRAHLSRSADRPGRGPGTGIGCPAPCRRPRRVRGRSSCCRKRRPQLTMAYRTGVRP
jgi:deoxyribodipyrimidine photo-lyase